MAYLSDDQINALQNELLHSLEEIRMDDALIIIGCALGRLIHKIGKENGAEQAAEAKLYFDDVLAGILRLLERKRDLN